MDFSLGLVNSVKCEFTFIFNQNMQNIEEFEIKLYSTDDVCKLLHIGKQKCLQLFHSDEFPSIKIGRKFWVKADCLNEFLSHKRLW